MNAIKTVYLGLQEAWYSFLEVRNVTDAEDSWSQFLWAGRPPKCQRCFMWLYCERGEAKKEGNAHLLGVQSLVYRAISHAHWLAKVTNSFLESSRKPFGNAPLLYFNLTFVWRMAEIQTWLWIFRISSVQEAVFIFLLIWVSGSPFWEILKTILPVTTCEYSSSF